MAANIVNVPKSPIKGGSDVLKAADLCCCAGGAGRGLKRAGFYVVGFDTKPQPRYGGDEFVQADALGVDLSGFDFVWASPPCQFGTELRHAPGTKKDHVNLIPPVRAKLQASGLPYTIENVRGARSHLVRPFMLCGTMFGLSVTAAGREWELQRHRYFEANFPIEPPPCRHLRPVMGVYGGHIRARAKSVGGRRTRDFDNDNKPEVAARIMGIDWMTMNELSEAIPPAYAEYIGRAAIEHIQQQRQAA